MSAPIDIPHQDLTYKIIGAAMRIHSRLGPGLREKHYQRALTAELTEMGLAVSEEHFLELYNEEKWLGRLYLDHLVEQRVVVEIKALSHLLTNDEIGQVICYLAATNLKVELLVGILVAKNLLMGMGSKPAIVRLLFMGTRPNNPPPTTSIISNKPQPQATTQIVSKPYEHVEYEDDDSDVIETSSEGVEVSLEEADEDASVAKEVMEELLEKMDIDGSKVQILKAESTRADESTHWILNIVGRNINRLIGHRGETLSSLQYITRLIVSRRLQRRANIIVDAGGYKAKRSDRLRQLANRMAHQAIRQARTVTLEPMPPHERRINHLTLRKRSDVRTKSVGGGCARAPRTCSSPRTSRREALGRGRARCSTTVRWSSAGTCPSCSDGRPTPKGR